MEQQAGLSLDCARLSWLIYTGRKNGRNLSKFYMVIMKNANVAWFFTLLTIQIILKNTFKNICRIYLFIYLFSG